MTQLLLGASVGEAVLGRKVGRRAALWGAVCGTLPDLDVFVPFPDAVSAMTYHRSFSHSLLVLAVVTPLMVWLVRKLHPSAAATPGQWAALVYLVFATHVLLDALTVYGTQIFWPIVTTPVMGSTIFIIDPLYTIPLLIGVLAVLIMRGNPARAQRWNRAALALSSVYLLWSASAKWHVTQVAEADFERRGITYERLLTTPTPFNTLLWRVVAVNEEHYWEGFDSLLDGHRSLSLRRFDRGLRYLQGLQSQWSVQRLQWFTHGFYAVGLWQDAVVMQDLRMGLEPDYAFSFQVGRLANPHAEPVPNRRVSFVRAPDNVRQRLRWLWRRIWSAEVPWPAT